MPKTNPLILTCHTVEGGTGWSATAEPDPRIHTKANEEMIGFEVWTPFSETEEKAKEQLINYLTIILPSGYFTRWTD